MACGLFGSTTLAIRQGSETQFAHGRTKTPNASLQAIELNPKCSGQAHFKGPKTGPGNENMEYISWGKAIIIIIGIDYMGQRRVHILTAIMKYAIQAPLNEVLTSSC